MHAHVGQPVFGLDISPLALAPAPTQQLLQCLYVLHRQASAVPGPPCHLPLGRGRAEARRRPPASSLGSGTCKWGTAVTAGEVAQLSVERYGRAQPATSQHCMGSDPLSLPNLPGLPQGLLSTVQQPAALTRWSSPCASPQRRLCQSALETSRRGLQGKGAAGPRGGGAGRAGRGAVYPYLEPQLPAAGICACRPSDLQSVVWWQPASHCSSMHRHPAVACTAHGCWAPTAWHSQAAPPALYCSLMAWEPRRSSGISTLSITRSVLSPCSCAASSASACRAGGHKTGRGLAT